MFGGSLPIVLHAVRLGTHTAQIPVADIQGNGTGKTLVVTAGMDGDEYAGIEAAYALATMYRSSDFIGRLVVVPIVNTSGFFAEQSSNPLDGLYPKHVFPGTPSGTATERLVDWLAESYLHSADIWLDLHDGALTETTLPMLWTCLTDNPMVDSYMTDICTHSGASLVAQEYSDKAHMLAARNTAYVLAESGGRGERTATAIQRHLRYAQACMETLGMLPRSLPTVAPPVVTTITYVKAPHEGLWSPVPAAPRVAKSAPLGVLTTLDGKSETLVAETAGHVLYRKETMAARTGDTLCAIGY